jgi:hypothetical protein
MLGGREMRALALLLALGAAGCMGTALRAHELRAPMLFGPVPCIACSAAERPPAPPTFHVAGVAEGYGVVDPTPPSGALVTGSSQGGVAPDRLFFGIACTHDIQLTNVRAGALAAFVPLLAAGSKQSVDGYAAEVNVPGATCEPF